MRFVVQRLPQEARSRGPPAQIDEARLPTPSSNSVKRMKKKRSPPRILSSCFSINSWLHQMPSVEEARPSQCPDCDEPSRPVGAPLNIQGHGQRERQVRGPLEPDGLPVQVVLMLRRYLCQRCGATMTVGPKGCRRR